MSQNIAAYEASVY